MKIEENVSMEKVSVIVPCYNGEKFVDRCLESIYRQDYPQIELIVIDDGSVDESKKKIMAWEKKFHERNSELVYLYQENQGPGAAINSGLKLITGDFVILLDIDDEFLSGALSEKVEYLKENVDVDVVRSNGWIVKNNRKYLFVYEENEKSKEDIFLSLLRGETNNWAGSYMVRVKALFDFYPEREIYKSRYGQNLQFLLPLVYKKRCGFIDKPHMNYIQQENSLSQTEDPENAISKSLENANGYRDIRAHMVETIVSDATEKEFYFNMLECGYWKSIMNIAVLNNNIILMKNAYSKKINYEKPSIDDKITYYGVTSPYKAFLYKVLRKLCFLFCK